MLFVQSFFFFFYMAGRDQKTLLILCVSQIGGLAYKILEGIFLTGKTIFKINNCLLLLCYVIIIVTYVCLCCTYT